MASPSRLDNNVFEVSPVDFVICTFCLKNVTSESGSNGGDGFDINGNNNGTINRFVKLVKNFVGQSVTGFTEKSSEFTGCCEDCCGVISSLCSLHQQIKCLELKLEWKVETLVNLMTTADAIPLRMEQFGELRKMESFKSFRADLIKKCLSRLSKSQPFLHGINKNIHEASQVSKVPTVPSSSSIDTFKDHQQLSVSHSVKNDQVASSQEVEIGGVFQHRIPSLKKEETVEGNDGINCPSDNNDDYYELCEPEDIDSDESHVPPNSEVNKSQGQASVYEEALVEGTNEVEMKPVPASTTVVPVKVSQDASIRVKVSQDSPPQRYNFREKRKRVHEDIKQDEDDEEEQLGSDSDSDFENDQCEKVSSDKSGPTKAKKPKNQPFTCSLDGCKFLSYHKDMYEQHKTLHAPGEFKCNFCNVVETNVYRLSVHERKAHSDPSTARAKRGDKKMFHCPRCTTFTFRRISAYHWHFAQVHIGGFERKRRGMVECEICRHRMSEYVKTRHFQRWHDTTGIEPEQIIKCSVEGCMAYFKTVDQKFMHNKNVHTGNFKCQFCGKIYCSTNTLSQHELICTKNKTKQTKQQKKIYRKKAHIQTFLCPVKVCGERFLTAETLESHKKLHEKFKCEFCDVTKEYAPHLAIHELEHAIRAEQISVTKVASKGFHCPRCPINFTTKGRYIRHHLKTHLNLSCTMTATLKCSICSAEGLIGHKFLKHHVKIHHNTDGMDPADIQRCDQCPAYFVKSDQLIQHKFIVHYKKKCPVCDKSFLPSSISRPSNFRVHLENNHPMVNVFPNFIFPCDMGSCKRRFGTKAELDHHKKYERHFDESLMQCSKCGKKVKGEEKLRTHMYACIKTPDLICPKCGKAFNQKHRLSMHMEYHKTPDEWEFQCATCQRRFATKYKLEDHARTHTKEKPYICQFCGEKYAHRHNWRGHLKAKHQDEMDEQEDTSVEADKATKNRKGSKKPVTD